MLYSDYGSPVWNLRVLNNSSAFLIMKTSMNSHFQLPRAPKLIRCTKLNSEVDGIKKKSLNDKILIVNAICKHKNGIRKQINKQKRRKTTPTHNNTNS